jgi:hypothetical protein
MNQQQLENRVLCLLEPRYRRETDPWILCPCCFRVFRYSEILIVNPELIGLKYCPYPDCPPQSGAYTVDYWAIRLFNLHLPKSPKHGVDYSKKTKIIVPYHMKEKQLKEVLEKLREADDSQG